MAPFQLGLVLHVGSLAPSVSNVNLTHTLKRQQMCVQRQMQLLIQDAPNNAQLACVRGPVNQLGEAETLSIDPATRKRTAHTDAEGVVACTTRFCTTTVGEPETLTVKYACQDVLVVRQRLATTLACVWLVVGAT